MTDLSRSEWFSKRRTEIGGSDGFRRVLSSDDPLYAETHVILIYYVHFLFRNANALVYQLIRAVGSPMAGKLPLNQPGKHIRRGHDIRDMKR